MVCRGLNWIETVVREECPLGEVVLVALWGHVNFMAGEKGAGSLKERCTDFVGLWSLDGTAPCGEDWWWYLRVMMGF